MFGNSWAIHKSLDHPFIACLGGPLGGVECKVLANWFITNSYFFVASVARMNDSLEDRIFSKQSSLCLNLLGTDTPLSWPHVSAPDMAKFSCELKDENYALARDVDLCAEKQVSGPHQRLMRVLPGTSPEYGNQNWRFWLFLWWKPARTYHC